MPEVPLGSWVDWLVASPASNEAGFYLWFPSPSFGLVFLAVSALGFGSSGFVFDGCVFFAVSGLGDAWASSLCADAIHVHLHAIGVTLAGCTWFCEGDVGVVQLLHRNPKVAGLCKCVLGRCG